jgi:hypothetical protein
MDVKLLTAVFFVYMSLAVMPADRALAQSSSHQARKSPGTHSRASLKGNWAGYYRWASDDAKQNFELDQMVLSLDDSGGQLTGQLIVSDPGGDAWQQPVSGSLDQDGAVELFLESTSYDTPNGNKSVMAKVFRGKLISGGSAIEGKVDMDRGREFRLNRTQQSDSSMKQRLSDYQRNVVNAKESARIALQQQLSSFVGTWKSVYTWGDDNRGHCGSEASHTVIISLKDSGTDVLSGWINNSYESQITRDDSRNGTCSVGHKLHSRSYRQTGDVEVKCPDIDTCLMRTNISQCTGEYCEEKMWRPGVAVCKIPSSLRTPQSFALDCVWSAMYDIASPNGTVFRKQ